MLKLSTVGADLALIAGRLIQNQLKNLTVMVFVSQHREMMLKSSKVGAGLALTAGKLFHRRPSEHTTSVQDLPNALQTSRTFGQRRAHVVQTSRR